MGSKRDRNKDKAAVSPAPVPKAPPVSPDAKYQVKWTAVIAVVSTLVVLLMGGWSLKSCGESNRSEREVAGDYRMPQRTKDALFGFTPPGLEGRARQAVMPVEVVKNEMVNIHIGLRPDGRATITMFGTAAAAYFRVHDDRVDVEFDDFDKAMGAMQAWGTKHYPQIPTEAFRPGAIKSISLKRTANPDRLLFPMTFEHDASGGGRIEEVLYDDSIFVERR